MFTCHLVIEWQGSPHEQGALSSHQSQLPESPLTTDLTSFEQFLEPVWEQQWIIPVQFNFADAESHSAVVEDIIPRIRGGDTSYSGGLLNSWDGKMYRYWGRSLKYNPAVIDFQVRLFCS